MGNRTPECDRLPEAVNAVPAAEPDTRAVIATVSKTGTSHCMTLHGDLYAPDAQQPFLEFLNGDTSLAYLILATPQTAGTVPSFDFATRSQSQSGLSAASGVRSPGRSGTKAHPPHRPPAHLH